MRKARNINKKRNFRVKCVSCPIEIETYSSSTSKAEALICHKSSLEILLNEIKNSQISILSYSGKAIKNNMKTILSELNKNLNFMLKEKKQKIKKITEENSEEKSSLQNQIFNDQIENKTKNKQYLNNEISLLKGLNLSINCYLEKIDNIIDRKNNEINFLNMCMKFTYQEEKEIYCNDQKHLAIVTKLLHKKITDIRKEFILIVSAKQYQNEEIESATASVAQLKNYIETKKNGYMDDNSVIEEESKEFTQSMTFNKMNNITNHNLFNNHNNNNKLHKEKEKHIHTHHRDNNKHYSEKHNNNIIFIDNEDDDDSAFSSNDSNTSKKKKNKENNINNNIQNLINFNMNINLNVHFDNLGQDNIIFNSERNNYDIINVLNNNKRKKGLSSTGSLPRFLINQINDELKDNPIEVCNTEIIDVNNNNLYNNY